MSLSYDVPVQTGPAPVRLEYAAGYSFKAFLSMVGKRHPWMCRLLDARCETPGWASAEIMRLNELSWEFEDSGNGGRGVEYNLAQRNSGNRRVGMTGLLSLFGADDGAVPGPETVILDVLAGDGTLRRFAEQFCVVKPEIICGDLSRLMIDACVERGYPCIRQSASQSFFADATLDGVLLAYGSHHLPAEDRQRAAREAFRTLEPGGRFVLHDFETGGPVDRWFRLVVDPYSATGHPHPHFSRAEMDGLLRDAGFREVRVATMEDPFVLCGDSAGAARHAMLQHLHTMYGLVKLPFASEGDGERLAALALNTLGDVSVSEIGDRHEATLMRHALVAVGVK